MFGVLFGPDDLFGVLVGKKVFRLLPFGFKGATEKITLQHLAQLGRDVLEPVVGTVELV